MCSSAFLSWRDVEDGKTVTRQVPLPFYRVSPTSLPSALAISGRTCFQRTSSSSSSTRRLLLSSQPRISLVHVFLALHLPNPLDHSSWPEQLLPQSSQQTLCSSAPAMPDPNDSGPAAESPDKLGPGNPKSPFDPPQRRSSFALFQLLMGTPTKSAAEMDARTPNVGRKRIHATPLMRPAATPGRAPRIQRIFQDASAMMQPDVVYAKSLGGFVDSSISPSSTSTPNRTLPPFGPDIVSWRLSSVSPRLTGADCDVQDPIPTLEPPSSGYLPPLPHSSPPTRTETPHYERMSQAGDSQVDGNICEAGSSELDQPLSELNVNYIPTAPFAYYAVTIPGESPETSSDPRTGFDIFCSPATKAAAHSAKLRRGINLPVHHQTKENHGLASQCSESSVHQATQSHIPIPNLCCPEPSMHHGTPEPKLLAIACQLPYRRANSRGSPLPPPKTRTPSTPHNNRSPPPLERYGLLPVASGPTMQPFFTSPPPVEHSQPGWSKLRAQDANREACSISTETARITESSTAPDFGIRDSYRIATLRPLVKPHARSEKAGIVSTTRGAGRFYGAQAGLGRMPVLFGSSPPRPIKGLPKKRTRDGEACSLDDMLLQEYEKVIMDLSPKVTPYRKGSEPKKARRVSYWDKDILGPETKENARFEEAVCADSLEMATEEMDMSLDKDEQGLPSQPA